MGEVLHLPDRCAVSLTFADVGENGPRMEKIGRPTTNFISGHDLLRMKHSYEGQNGVAELFDLKKVLEESVETSKLPEVREAAVLVLRGFTDCVIGEGTLIMIESEVQSMKRDGLVDNKALMHGQVKNKNARHNNVIANFRQSPAIADGKGTVVAFEDYPATRKMRDVAQTWMQQEHPLVAEQNRYYDVETCGIGW